ncbi:MAG: hypothetical protein GY811_28935 [Myxococcales bacterium]|nr:hypothetical protein [Myxococcales bacterium]
MRIPVHQLPAEFGSEDMGGASWWEGHSKSNCSSAEAAKKSLSEAKTAFAGARVDLDKRPIRLAKKRGGYVTPKKIGEEFGVGNDLTITAKLIETAGAFTLRPWGKRSGKGNLKVTMTDVVFGGVSKRSKPTLDAALTPDHKWFFFYSKVGKQAAGPTPPVFIPMSKVIEEQWGI